jgi:hypothetical protein
LKRVLQSLSINDLSGYSKLYCAIEPGCDEVFELCRNIKFIPTELILNEEVLGVKRNPYELLNRLFEDGSDYNVYLEDDSILSPDAILLSNFFYDNFKHDEYFACCFHNYKSDKAQKKKCIAVQELVAIGFSLFKSAWNKWFKPYWFDDAVAREYDTGGVGWDWSIRGSMKKHKKLCLTPCYSRSMHIGKSGVHSTPQDHARLFAGKLYCGSNIGGFHL